MLSSAGRHHTTAPPSQRRKIEAKWMKEEAEDQDISARAFSSKNLSPIGKKMMYED